MSDQSALSGPLSKGKGDARVERRARQQVGPSPWERGAADRIHDRVHPEAFAQRVQRELASRSASVLAKRPSRQSLRSPSTSAS